jgi:hypothetical protein
VRNDPAGAATRLATTGKLFGLCNAKISVPVSAMHLKALRGEGDRQREADRLVHAAEYAAAAEHSDKRHAGPRRRSHA